jgi:hypothetical protein
MLKDGDSRLERENKELEDRLAAARGPRGPSESSHGRPSQPKSLSERRQPLQRSDR